MIDSSSTDRTLEIAEEGNVKIIKRKFDDFYLRKNFVIQQAKYPWVYILDVDEKVTAEVEQEILESLKNPKEYVGFMLEELFIFVETK